jgi:hypothetical protein
MIQPFLKISTSAQYKPSKTSELASFHSHHVLPNRSTCHHSTYKIRPHYFLQKARACNEQGRVMRNSSCVDKDINLLLLLSTCNLKQISVARFEDFPQLL